MAEFLPLTEIDPQYCNVRLPEYVPADRIGMDVRWLGALAHLGGFQRQVNVTSYSGDVTKYSAQVVGASGQGTAFAGVGAVQKAELSKPEFEDDNSLLLPIHTRPPLQIGVNMDEFSQRMSHSRSNLREPSAWASHLNAAVMQGLRQATWEHYVKHPHRGELIFWGSSRLLNSVTSGMEAFSPYSIAGSLLFANVVKAFMGKAYGWSIKDLCLSLTPVIHIDRAIAVSGLSRVRPVVKGL